MKNQNTTYLYRHFDKYGNLLYVGISISCVARLSQHRSHSHWFTSIAMITIEKFNSRSKAEEAEMDAIGSERPLHNITYNYKSKGYCEQYEKEREEEYRCA